MKTKPRAKVLIVDDRPENLLALEAVLETLNCTLVRAHSGEEALKLVEECEFAAIVMDLQMPGLDGFETTRRIKRLPKGENTPIVFVTSIYKEDEDVKRAYEAGGIDFFAKPFNADVLRTKVHLYTELYEKNRLIREQEKILDKRLETVLHAVSEGVILVDSNGKIIQANEEARKIWNNAKMPSLERLKEAARRESRNEALEIEHLDGTTETVLASAEPLRDENGDVVGGCLIVNRPVQEHEPQ